MRMIDQSGFCEVENMLSGWGKLYIPRQRKENAYEGLRILLLGSTTAGKLVIEHLSRFEKVFPEKLNLVGVCTDDPIDPKARISVRKRIWAHYNLNEQQRLVDEIITASLTEGIPCYTGAVKSEYFRNLLRDWNPELIIMCCFGQKIDEYIYNFPQYGMYNFHPSDLKRKIGAGAEPFADTIKNEKSLSYMSLHKVNEIIDGGPVIGVSPPINICLKDGTYPVSVLTLQEKIPSICGWMTIDLVMNIIKNLESGKHDQIHCINFNLSIPEYIKRKLLEPVEDDPHTDYRLPMHQIFNDFAANE